MITMLIAMRLSLFSCARSVSLKAAIIGLCLCLLGGCSAVRVSYNQGETLAWWWLDGYVDFNAAQTPAVKQAVQQWFVWHRRSQLPDYAALLMKAQSEVLQPVTAAQLCRWADVLRQRVSTGLDQAVLLAAPIVPGLSSEELTHIERHFRKLNEDYRDEYLSGSAERRLDSMVERVVDRGETLYGPLNDEQRRLLAAAMAASPSMPSSGWPSGNAANATSSARCAACRPAARPQWSERRCCPSCRRWLRARSRHRRRTHRLCSG